MKKFLKSTLFFIGMMVNIPLVLADSSFITVYENIGYGGQSQIYEDYELKTGQFYHLNILQSKET